MKKLICVVLAMLLLTACGADPVAPKPVEVTAQIQGQEVTFQAWEGSGLPTDGSYYLTKDVEIAETVVVTGDLKLHLNGHMIVAAHDTVITNMFSVPAGTTMAVYDEAVPEDLFSDYDPEEEENEVEIPGGAIVSSRSFSGKVTVANMFRVAGRLVIAGGHINASLINVEDRANGLVAYIEEGGSLEMTGGVVTGGTTWSFAPEIAPAETPAPTTPATTPTEPATTEPAPTETTAPVETTAPTVPPETTPQPAGNERYGYGGAFYVAKGASCTLSGGTIWKGSAYEGGNIFVAGDDESAGTLTITDGYLLAGEATSAGGNVCVRGVLEMSGGTMDWGSSYCDGGNMFLSGKLNMTGGTLRGGACDANTIGYKYGGNLAVDGIHASVKITNAQILDGTAACKESHGGNISVIRYGAEEFEVGEGTYIYGGLGHRGGNVYIGHLKKDVPLENTDYVFTKVEMNGGNTTYRGANMCSDTKNAERPIQVTFNDCTMGVEDASERNLAIGAGATDISQCIITINGGTFDGGEIHIYGSSQVTANGVKFINCPVGGTGIYTENP